MHLFPGNKRNRIQVRGEIIKEGEAGWPIVVSSDLIINGVSIRVKRRSPDRGYVLYYGSDDGKVYALPSE